MQDVTSIGERASTRLDESVAGGDLGCGELVRVFSRGESCSEWLRVWVKAGDRAGCRRGAMVRRSDGLHSGFVWTNVHLRADALFK